jgi:two-component system, NarL family, nitrate/nitrite response regulator NarL
MTEPVARASSSLRVVIATRSDERRAWLTALLQSLGHTVAVGTEPADVVLADHEALRARDHPAVVLGGADADAQGLLPEGAGAGQIAAALHAVASGLIVRSPATRGGFGPAVEPAARGLLTPREAQVLDAIADGLTNKAIARRLGISLHTVKFHVEAVFRKLEASTRAEAVARAAERRRAETIEL